MGVLCGGQGSGAGKSTWSQASPLDAGDTCTHGFHSPA